MTRTTVRTTPTVLEVIDCPRCGVEFGVPLRFEKARRQDSATFYCPSGHPMSFHETEEDKQRKRADRLDARLTAAQDQRRAADAALEHERRSKAAVKGWLTRQRNRAAAGQCPDCVVVFPDLRRHMERVHPDHATADIDETAGPDHEETTP